MNRPILFAILLALAVAPVSAQQSDWQILLTNRLETEKGCEVQFYSGVVERMVGDKQVIIAKAHCKDRRAFDVTRNSQFEPFVFKECQPQPAAC